MVRKETRKDSLLRLISDIGGEATREQINTKVPKYWELSNEELEIEKGVGKPLYWHRVAGVCQSLKDRDGYLENPRRGVWKVTEAGKKHLSSMRYRPFPSNQKPPPPIGDLPLCKKLRETQRNSEKPSIFEEALVEAFNALGFSAKQIGGRDEPDVFINDKFNIILDAKTTKEGVISERYINFDAMDRYKESEKYQAKHIGVVAPGFSDGYIRETAKKRGIILIETESICKMLQNHVIYPYELDRIVEILFESGKSIITPNDIPPSTIDQEKLIDIVAKTITILKNFEKANIPTFSANNIRIALLGQGVNYDVDEIENALKFLSVVPFNILQMQNDEYSLTGDIESILKKVGLLLQAFSKIGR
jgi:hypothetical protein